MDHFGDHLVSCRFNSLTERHHGVRKALAICLQGVGIACVAEDKLPGSNERPGDISFPFLDARGKLMVDLVACHPLALSRGRSSSECLSSLAQAESDKLTKYEDECTKAGILFSPLGFHLWGGLGPLGSALMNRLVR